MKDQKVATTACSWFRLESTGEAVVINRPLEAYLAGLGECVHFITLLYRPEASEFMVAFEKAHFPPGTPTNDRYYVTVVIWQGVEWAIASFPPDYLGQAEAWLPRFGLKPACGVPAIVEGFMVVTVTPGLLEGLDMNYVVFPAGNLSRVFTLENAVPAGEPCVSGVVLFPERGDRVNRG